MSDELATIDHAPETLATTHAMPPDRHPVTVYLSRLVSPASRRTMRQALNAVAELLTGGRLTPELVPWWTLGYQHAAAIRAALVGRYSPATTNKSMSALRGVLDECEGLGLMAGEARRAAIKALRPVKSETAPRGRALAAGELHGLFVACAASGNRGAGVRDAALLALLYGCGLRRAEAVALDVSDIDTTTGLVAVRGGKGRKDRNTYAGPGALAAVVAWLALRGDEPGPLLNPVLKNGRIPVRRLTAQAARLVCDERGKQAGVLAFSPHDLRRTFISDLLDAGADIVSVQKLAGHARPETTSRYDRRGEAVKARAAAMLHVPFVASVAA